MVYATGDCHADFLRFSKTNFPDQKQMTRDDTVIVLGDFGIWHDTDRERDNFEWLSKKKFTIVFVDGNHENFDRLYSDEFQIVDFHGGKAHKIRDNIYHLLRGYIFDFDGKSFFAFGGASSHDISDGILDIADFNSDSEFWQTYERFSMERRMFRVNHLSWWKQELPSDDEMQRGIETLNRQNEVDFIITHCCPQEVASLAGFRDSDRLTQYFNVIANTTKFGKWYFGHYHDNRNIMSKFVMLYEKIERIV